MHGQSSWSSQVGLDKWQIFKVMKQGIGTSYFASSSIPWMADHGYNFMQPFYSSDSSRMIIFAPAICRTFMQFPSACAKIEQSYFPKKVFLHILPPGFLSFLLENPLSIVIGLVGFQVFQHPKHTVEFSQFSHSSSCGPSTAPRLGCSIDDFPSASGTRANPPT